VQELRWDRCGGLFLLTGQVTLTRNLSNLKIKIASFLYNVKEEANNL
jgi:hypothetical protein